MTGVQPVMGGARGVLPASDVALAGLVVLVATAVRLAGIVAKRQAQWAIAILGLAVGVIGFLNLTHLEDRLDIHGPGISADAGPGLVLTVIAAFVIVVGAAADTGRDLKSPRT